MGRRRALWGGVTALGALVAWTPVLAQASDPQSAADVRHITIAPQVETTYDTNVARTDEAYARLRHLSEEDVLVQPAVTVDALMPVSREAVFLTGVVGYDIYARDTVLNRERIDLNGGVRARFAHCTPQLTGGYARHQSQLEELLPGPGAQIATPSNTATLANVGVEVSCPREEGFSPTVSVTHSTTENSDRFYQYTNNTSNAVTAGLSYARPGFGVVQLYGDFNSVAYSNPLVVPFAPFKLKNDFNLYAGGLRYDRPIGSRLSGTLSVSYSSLQPSAKINPGFSGLTYNAELSYHLSSRLTVHALVSRATLPSNEVGAAYSVADARQLDASYALGSRLKLTLGGFDGPRTFKDGFSQNTFVLMTHERIDRVFGTVNVALGRRLSLVVDAINEHREANVALYNYTSNRISLTLKSVF